MRAFVRFDAGFNVSDFVSSCRKNENWQLSAVPDLSFRKPISFDIQSALLEASLSLDCAMSMNDFSETLHVSDTAVAVKRPGVGDSSDLPSPKKARAYLYA